MLTTRIKSFTGRSKQKIFKDVGQRDARSQTLLANVKPTDESSDKFTI